MPNYVPDDGSKSAPLVLIGEAPGQRENIRKRPFVGPSGLKLNRWLEAVALDRKRDCYLTNVYPYQPPKNKLAAIPKDELRTWIDALHDRIAALEAPRVLVPMGNYALNALGLGKLPITKARGYLFEYTDRNGRKIPVIPTVHPAACFREPAQEVACRADMAKIATILKGDTPEWTEADHYTRPTWDDIEDFIEQARDAEAMSIDIETPGNKIVCVGFAYDPSHSLVIPLDDDNRHWRTVADRERAWEYVRTLCALPTPKVLQNGLFDRFWLATDPHAITIANHRWDLRAMHHVLHPQQKHSLEYIASMYRFRTYWKDEAKDPVSMARYASDFDAMLVYCGIDNTEQRALYTLLRAELRAAKLEDVYLRLMQRLYDPLLAVSVYGIRVDGYRQRVLANKLEAACIGLQDKLEAVAGYPLHGKQSLSNVKVSKFLYETLKLPKQHKRGTTAATTDETALRKLQLRVPEHAPALGLVLEHRRKHQLLSFLKEDHLDPDGRVRCEYGLYTDTLRLSSKRNPRGTGQNLQNIDREIRGMFLPDDGAFLLEVDMSQAESRVVGVLTGDADLIAIARSHPTTFDVHRFNASIIFNKHETEITKEERYLAKRAVHASNYGMGGMRLSEILLNDTESRVVRTPDECQAMVNAYIDKFPAIRFWQRRVRLMVLTKEPITTTWGWHFRHVEGRINEELFKSAYAFRPQSEVGCALNQWGLIPLQRYIEDTGMRSRINLQVHDSLVISTYADEAYDIASFLRESLERPRTYDGVELTIPIEYKLGLDWGHAIELKALPTASDFDAHVASLYAVKGAA